MLQALRSLISRWFRPANLPTAQSLPEVLRDDAEASTPAEPPLSAVAPHPGPYDENLLGRSRTLWRQGDWSKLVSLDTNDIEHHPDRAKLSLIVASAWLQQGDDAAARRYMRHALDWGCDKKIAAQILVAGVHNSLGRIAAINGDEPRIERHFREAVAGGGKVSNDSLGRRHAEMIRLGLAHPPVRLSDEIQQVNHAAIWLPNFIWLPFALTVADEINHRIGVTSILVIPDNVEIDSPSRSSVHAVIHLSEFDIAVRRNSLKISCLALHSYGWRHHAQHILELLPKARRIWYADGFKNLIDIRMVSECDEIISFGFPAPMIEKKHWTVDFETVQANISAVVLQATGGAKPQLKKPIDVVICLRYYGINQYQPIGLDQMVVGTMQTIQYLQNSENIFNIAVKADTRSSYLQHQFISGLREKLPEYSISSLEDILDDSNWGLRPVEWLLEKGLLSDVSAFIVFDSSLAYLIPHHRNTKSNAKIVFGFTAQGYSSPLPSLVEQLSQETGLSTPAELGWYQTILFNTSIYVNALTNEGFTVTRLEETLYIVSKIEAMDRSSYNN